MFNCTKWKTDEAFPAVLFKPPKTLGKLSESLDKHTQIKQVEWKIPNCASLSLMKGVSPPFIFENISFHFALFLHKFLSLCFRKETLFPYPIEYTFSIKNVDGNLLGTFPSKILLSTITKPMEESTKFDVEELLMQNKMDYKLTDGLTVVCQLQIMQEAKKADTLKEQSRTGSTEVIQLAETDVLSKNLKELFINKVSTDTVLQVNGKEFNVHKAIIIARSSVFAAMFQHDTSEKQTGIINIPDCDPDSFQEFLEYLYSGKLEGISCDKAIHLYRTSDKYDVQELKTFCTKYMMQNLTLQNVCDVVVLADQYDETMLFSVAQDFFNENLKEILVTTEWANLMKMNDHLANKLLIQMSNSIK